MNEITNEQLNEVKLLTELSDLMIKNNKENNELSIFIISISKNELNTETTSMLLGKKQNIIEGLVAILNSGQDENLNEIFDLVNSFKKTP